MQLEDAREHAEHLCDVWPIDQDDEHIGVIEDLDERLPVPSVLIGGHPEYPRRWFPISTVETNCKVVSHYHRPKPEASNAQRR